MSILFVYFMFIYSFSKWWQHSGECVCRLLNIAMIDYQESVTTGQIDGQTDRQTQDKMILICRYASQATQKIYCLPNIYRSFDFFVTF